MNVKIASHISVLYESALSLDIEHDAISCVKKIKFSLCKIIKERESNLVHFTEPVVV